MTFYRSKITYIIFSILFFALGCVVTVGMKKSGVFSLSNEIDLADILSIVVTVLVGLYIAIFVDKNKEIKRTTKDMFISYYKAYFDFLQSRMSEIVEEPILSKKFSNFKIIRKRLYYLNKISNDRNIIKSDNILIHVLNADVTSLWKKCTENLVIVEEEKENIELIIIKIEGIIHQLIFEINEK